MIRIPEFTRSPYPFIVLLGITAGFITSVILMRRKGVEKLACFLSSFLAIASILIMNFTGTFKGNIRDIGFDGTIGAVALASAAFASALIFREKGSEIMASFITSAPLMYSISKIGCFLSGCCKGFIYGGPLRVEYHGVSEITYFPLQLLDSACFMIIFVVALILTLKSKNLVISTVIIMILSIMLRFGLDFFRFSHRDKVISKVQFLMIIAFVIVIISFIILLRIQRNRGNKNGRV